MAMTLIDIYVVSVLVILGYMTVVWIASLFLRNSSIVDIFWSFQRLCWLRNIASPLRD
jgi:steroid 5-alpha reductase family enzyme